MNAVDGINPVFTAVSDIAAERRENALSYALKTADRGEDESSIIRRAKAFEAYVSGVPAAPVQFVAIRESFGEVDTQAMYFETDKPAEDCDAFIVERAAAGETWRAYSRAK